MGTTSRVRTVMFTLPATTVICMTTGHVAPWPHSSGMIITKCASGPIKITPAMPQVSVNPSKHQALGQCRADANPARKNPVFSDADYAWRVFLQHVTLLAIVIGHRATTKKRWRYVLIMLIMFYSFGAGIDFSLSIVGHSAERVKRG